MKKCSRRQWLFGLGSIALLPLAQAGAQREETLADNVASSMRQSVANVNAPRLYFSSPQAAAVWLAEMQKRIGRFESNPIEQRMILLNVHYEATRAGLDPQLVLALIEVESAFRRYAVSNVGAKGLMQVMPFWVRYIGASNHNLFDVRTNLRYGCTILRHYLNLENGNMSRALGRFNGSLGKPKYPNAVLGAYQRNWQYNGSL